jgi:hypothetical protein
MLSGRSTLFLQTLFNSIFSSRLRKPKSLFLNNNNGLYGAAGQSKTITLKCIREKYEKGLALTAVTAYDYSSATHVFFLSVFNQFCLCVLR